jgi:hypothetical protein
VDGVYWGRSATGKRPLSDAEVTRLMGDRGRQDEQFKSISRRWIQASILSSLGSGRGDGYMGGRFLGGRKATPCDLNARHTLLGCAPSCEPIAATDNPEAYSRAASSTSRSERDCPAPVCGALHARGLAQTLGRTSSSART